MITTQPIAQAVTTGGAANFSVVASGSGLTYQWRRNDLNIPGATASSYSLPSTTLADNGAQFSVVVGNLGGVVTSSSVTLAVGLPPTITQAPDPASVVVGSPVTFAVAASGTEPFTYQWRKGGVAIAGATQSAYTFTPTLADHNAQYSVVVSNVIGSATSTSAELGVFATAQNIVILQQPQDLTVRDSERATFNVAISGTGPFTLQWIRDGVDIPTARIEDVNSIRMSYSLVKALVGADNGVRISLRITNAAGSVTTRQALLTVLP